MIEIKGTDAAQLERAILNINDTASCITALTGVMLNPCANWNLSRAVGQDLVNVLRYFKCELARAITDAEAAFDAP